MRVHAADLSRPRTQYLRNSIPRGPARYLCHNWPAANEELTKKILYNRCTIGACLKLCHISAVHREILTLRYKWAPHGISYLPFLRSAIFGVKTLGWCYPTLSGTASPTPLFKIKGLINFRSYGDKLRCPSKHLRQIWFWPRCRILNEDALEDLLFPFACIV